MFNYPMILIWLEPGLGLLEELNYCSQPRSVRQIDALSVLDFRYKKSGWQGILSQPTAFFKQLFSLLAA